MVDGVVGGGGGPCVVGVGGSGLPLGLIGSAAGAVTPDAFEAPLPEAAVPLDFLACFFCFATAGELPVLCCATSGVKADDNSIIAVRHAVRTMIDRGIRILIPK